jgi:DNA polymerase elongation subunit (family B)
MIDPDVIIGYDLYSCEMEILLDRVKVLRVKEGNRLGRLKRVKE